MYPQIESFIPRSAIFFSPRLLCLVDRIAYGKLDEVLLRELAFTLRLSAKFDV